MISTDNVAYGSKLKRTDPRQKLAFALLTLGVCIWADTAVISFSVILIMGWMTVCRGGTPLRIFVRLLLLPMSFLLISVLTIAVNLSDKPEIFMISLPFSGNWMGISETGFHDALRLFLKALGAVSCLYFLSLSTPMVDLFAALRKLRVPKLLVEMMELIYRFIFVLLETSDTIVTAQNARLGYTRLSTGYRSLSTLVSSLFIRAYKRSDDLYIALESRGYNGELNVLEEPFEGKPTGYAVTLAVNVILIMATLYLN